MRTLYDRVFVKVSPTEKKQGGIILTVDKQEYIPTRTCEIVEAGDNCAFLKKGDMVVTKHRELSQLKDITELPKMRKEYNLGMEDKLYMTTEHTFEAIANEDGGLTPLTNRVLILPDPVPTHTEGGMYIPDSERARMKSLIGTVVKVGPGVHGYNIEPRPMTISVDDRVIYGEYSGVEVTINGLAHIIMKESEIYAIEQ